MTAMTVRGGSGSSCGAGKAGNSAERTAWGSATLVD